MSRRFGDVVLEARGVACPAGAPLAGCTACHCRVEDSVIDAKRSPSSLLAYCFNESGYQLCPSWRRDKEHGWEQRTNRRLLGDDGNFRATVHEDATPSWAS